jgi:curved DNA-binding protein CbpA
MHRSDASSGSQDHYAVLGVSATATPQEITRAYRALVRALHPDTATAPGETLVRFTAVTTAYAVLRDPARRAAYDQARKREYTAVPPQGRDTTDAIALGDQTADAKLIRPAAPAREPLLRVGPTRISPLPRRKL